MEGKPTTQHTHTLKEMKVDMDYGVSFLFHPFFSIGEKKKMKKILGSCLGMQTKIPTFSGRREFFENGSCCFGIRSCKTHVLDLMQFLLLWTSANIAF